MNGVNSEILNVPAQYEVQRGEGLLDAKERRILEERDRLLYLRHRATVRRQAEALVREQAEALALDLPLPR